LGGSGPSLCEMQIELPTFPRATATNPLNKFP
jgi:hypothetical protein